MEKDARNAARWRGFVAGMADLVDRHRDEAALLQHGAALLADLVRHDDWLPPEFAAPDPARYQQHLLYRDPAARFSVVSFVWSPGQATPIHDHCVWGLVGMLRGAESSQRFRHRPDGALVEDGTPTVLEPGDVEMLSPAEGDIHQVTNMRDAVSISIHVYGADIGKVRRHSFARDGSRRSFISGYSDTATPAGWMQGDAA